MSYFGCNDFWLEIAKGNVPGHAAIIVRGHNADIDDGAQEDVWEPGGELSYLSSAETMEIASTSADDAAAGTGARTVMIQGVDDDGLFISEVVTLNGTSNVQTSNSYLRVNLMNILTAGSAGWNVGDLTATATTAATIQDEMDATEGFSQSSHYTVPAGKTAFLTQVELNAAKLSGGGVPEIEFKAMFRPFGGAWHQGFDKTLDTSVTDELDIILPVPTRILERTDVRITALTDTNNSEARTRMYILEVEN